MHRPAIAWEGPLSIQEVKTQIAQALFGSVIQQTPAADEALRAEILRVAVWEQSVLGQPRSLSEAQVSTQKVLRRARFLWQPIAKNLPEELLMEEDLSRRMLDSLAEQGDLLSLSGGHWLPAPLRLVPLSLDRYLLAGGVPGRLLAREIFQKLYLHGSFRQITIDLTQEHSPFDGIAEPWQFQTLERWLGTPPLPFKDVLKRFREIELFPQTTQHAADVYIASRDKPQRQRWQPLENVSADGRYLLRSQKPWGERFYTIGSIKNRQVQQQSHNLEAWDIRRLCYALDDEAHRPTRAIWNGRAGTLTLKSELPARERKRLALLGHLQTNSTGSYYPRYWDISPDYEKDVRAILKGLSIILQ